jgi:hypothetical protein
VVEAIGPVVRVLSQEHAFGRGGDQADRLVQRQPAAGVEGGKAPASSRRRARWTMPPVRSRSILSTAPPTESGSSRAIENSTR